MSWVKKEDTAVERVNGLRAQTSGFEQEKEGASSWLYSVTLSDLLQSTGTRYIGIANRPTKSHKIIWGSALFSGLMAARDVGVHTMAQLFQHFI